MPILDVQIVGPVRGRRGLAQRLADAAGEILASPPGNTWVRLRSLSAGDYAENSSGGGGTFRPVFVTVLEARPPRGRALDREVARLTTEIAGLCGRPPANVHLLYDAPALGRIAFGGHLRRARTALRPAAKRRPPR